MKRLRILILGSGGREHALAWRLARDPGVEVLLAPGNAIAATSFACAPVLDTDVAAVVTLARREGVDLVVVGPEAPLAAGVADALIAAGIPVYGPVRDAAQIESSKWFAKELMREAGVPTARAAPCANADEVGRALDRWSAPYVVKADGLAAGKGVLVTTDRAEALTFAERCLSSAHAGGEARVVVEEFLAGEELSIMAVCDGERAVLLPAARDFKRAFDGDRGPNTGGMGAFAPVPGVDAELETLIQTRIVTPVLREMTARGTSYRGTLYCGLMLGPHGVRVVEFNCRFGDPETEVIMPLVSGRFAELLLGAARGSLDPACVGRMSGAAVAVALVDRNYPDAPSGTATLERLDEVIAREGVTVFGAALERDGSLWRIRGGRAAYVMAEGAALAAARTRAYLVIEALGGHGWRCRGDIAADAAAGSSGATGATGVHEPVRAAEI